MFILKSPGFHISRPRIDSDIWLGKEKCLNFNVCKALALLDYWRVTETIVFRIFYLLGLTYRNHF